MNTVLQQNIRQRLKHKNMSIAELERRIGLRHAVINIMHGRSKNPSIKVANAIAKELGCSMEAMLTTTDLKIENNVINNQPDSQPTIPWDVALGQAALKAVNDYVTAHQLTPDLTAVWHCMQEIYCYALQLNDKQIDPKFTQWICQRAL